MIAVLDEIRLARKQCVSFVQSFVAPIVVQVFSKFTMLFLYIFKKI